MTGRGTGNCAGGRPGAGVGRRRRGGGFGHGGGFGRGRGTHGIPEYADFDEPGEPLAPDEQRRTLKAERNRLKAALTQVEDGLRKIGPPPREDQ